METSRSRFLKALNNEMPSDRLPMIEWADYWDETLAAWESQGLPKGMTNSEICDSLGLDNLLCFRFDIFGNERVPWPEIHGAPIVNNEAEYNEVSKLLYCDEAIDVVLRKAEKIQKAHENGDFSIRVWLEGFFWTPRLLFGIEPHMFAFFDYPELMHRMNEDILNFNKKAITALCNIVKPDMLGIAEDMSYNNGPMLSEDMFDEFLLPYYSDFVPFAKNLGLKSLVDTDGDCAKMIPWLIRAGVDGVYPLERQAGVDVVQLKKDFPDFVFFGGYDKMIMDKGEEALRAEFERLLPAMRAGGFIPSCDHQTPPNVTLEDYKLYLKLFEEYCVKAVQG